MSNVISIVMYRTPCTTNAPRSRKHIRAANPPDTAGWGICFPGYMFPRVHVHTSNCYVAYSVYFTGGENPGPVRSYIMFIVA